MLRHGIGITLFATSLTAAAAGSHITIGSTNGGIEVISAGSGGSNTVSIGGKSIHTGNISSQVSAEGRSTISIGHVTSPPGESKTAPPCVNDCQNIDIHGDGQRTRIDASKATSLSLSGSGNEITVTAGQALKRITLSGAGNRLKIVSPLTSATLRLNGSGNTVQLPQDSQIQVVDSGLGNQILKYE